MFFPGSPQGDPFERKIGTTQGSKRETLASVGLGGSRMAGGAKRSDCSGVWGPKERLWPAWVLPGVPRMFAGPKRSPTELNGVSDVVSAGQQRDFYLHGPALGPPGSFPDLNKARGVLW